MKRKDGTIFPTEHSVIPLVNDNGKRFGWVSLVRDITDRKRAEEKLKQSEEKYRLVVENMIDGLYTLDEKGYFTFVNSVIEKRSGFSQDQFCKLHFLDVVTKDYHKEVRSNFKKVMNSATQRMIRRI